MNTLKNTKKFITLLIAGTIISKIISTFITNNIYNISNNIFSKILSSHILSNFDLPNTDELWQYFYNLWLLLYNNISNLIYLGIFAIIICLIQHYLKNNPTDSAPEAPVKKFQDTNSWLTHFCVYYTMTWIGNLVKIVIESIEEPVALAEFLASYVFDLYGMYKGSTTSAQYMQEEGWAIIIFGIILVPLVSNIVYRKILMDKLLKYGTGIAVLVPGVVIALISLYSLDLSYLSNLNYLSDLSFSDASQFMISILSVLGAMIVSMFLAYVYLDTKKVSTLISIQAITVLIQVLNETYWGVIFWEQIGEIESLFIGWLINAIWGMVELFLLVRGIIGIFEARSELKRIITKDDRKIVFKNAIYIVAILFILYNVLKYVLGNWLFFRFGVNLW